MNNTCVPVERSHCWLFKWIFCGQTTCKICREFLIVSRREMMEIGQSCWRICYRKWLTTPVAWSLDDGPRVFASKVVSMTPQCQFVHPLALKNSPGRYHQCSPEPRMWLMATLLPSPYPAGFISQWNTDPGSSRRRKVLNIFGARLQVKCFCRLHLMVSSALTANFTDNFTFPLS